MRMSETISTAYPYAVNHTKKEICQIPFNLTIWDERNGVLNRLSLIKEAVVATWRTLTTSGWSGRDDSTIIMDDNHKIRDYLNNGYELK